MITRTPTERIAAATDSRWLQRLMFAGLVSLVLTGLWHENHWHFLAASLFVVAGLALNLAQRIGRAIDTPRLRSGLDVRLGTISIYVATIGVFLPYATLAARGAPFWDGIVLAGSLGLLWFAMRELLWSWRRALIVVGWVALVWFGLLLASPVVARMSVWGITAVFSVVIAATLTVVLGEFRGMRPITHRVAAGVVAGGLAVAHPFAHFLEWL